jgi:transcriptional regulator with XRE-family HTH domain
MKGIEYDNDIYRTIRHNIRRYRKEKGITSAWLAEATELSHDYIRQLQSDSAGAGMSVETLYKISVALGVSLDKLIEK